MIIIPMAGMSRRFTEAGYDRPKYMLPVGDCSLFAWTVMSFRASFNRELIVFVFRNVLNTRQFIIQEMEALGIGSDWYQLVELEMPTSGQAETVALGCRALPARSQDSVTIFNIDTVRVGYTPPPFVIDGTADGFLEVFSAEGDHWSFVEPVAGTDRVCRTTEKIRISSYCSDGLYYFRTARMFLKAYEKIEKADVGSLQGAERYVAPMYNDLIAAGYDIRFSEVAVERLYFSGTPSEYEIFLTQADKLQGVI